MRKVLTICSIFSFAAVLCAQATPPPTMDPMLNPNYNRNYNRNYKKNSRRDYNRNSNRKKETRPRVVVFKDKVSSSAYPLSNKRLKQINDVVKGFLDRNEKLDDEAVLDTIYEQIGQLMVLTPEKPADLRKFEDFQKEIAPVVNKKFPFDSEQIRKEAEKEAENKFTMYKPQDQVKVFYQRGRNAYSISGTFYGYGGGSIQVNERHIAMFDLLPESRIKFDKAYNQKAREEFIDKKVTDYINKKYAFSNDLFRKAQKEQRTANEKLGYIYADRKWNTAHKMTEDAIAKAKAEAARKAEEARLKAEEEQKNGRRNPDEYMQQNDMQNMNMNMDGGYAPPPNPVY